METHRIIARTFTKWDRETKEFHVKAFDINGRRYPEADYFTNDETDAKQTAEKMVERGN